MRTRLFAPRDLRDETGAPLIWADFDPENASELRPPLTAGARAELLRSAPPTLQLLSPRRYLDAGLAGIAEGRAQYDEAALLQARLTLEGIAHPALPHKAHVERAATWYAKLAQVLAQSTVGPVIVNAATADELPVSWGEEGKSEPSESSDDPEDDPDDDLPADEGAVLE